MTTYTYGGAALTTYGKILNVDVFDLVERRGENIQLAFQDGTKYAQKFYSERTIMFEMVATASTAAAMETLIDALKTKFSPRTEQTLAETREDTTVRNISATVDVSIQPRRPTSKIVYYFLTFKCAFPFWRLSTAIADNTVTVNASPKAWSVTNPGTVEEYDATIILTGPLQNTVITNSTNGWTLTYTGTIASPRVVTIQKSGKEWIATTDLGANVIGNVTHTGGASFMRFDVGANTMSITDATATTGTVKASFYAPFG